jgi:ribosomal protein L22
VIRESKEYENDEIADDWRKLWDTITREVPVYMQKTNSSKVMNKITTVQQQAKRVAKKIESCLEQADLEDYRYKQGLKKWENNVKASVIRMPHPPKQEKQEYEEIEAEEEKG